MTTTSPFHGAPGEPSSHPHRPLTTLDLEEVGATATSKLPNVTAGYWVLKIAATTLGETGGDMFSQTLKIGYFLSTVAWSASS